MTTERLEKIESDFQEWKQGEYNVLAACNRYEKQVPELCAAIRELKTDGSPGVMHEIDQAFYNLAIKERDHERRKVSRLKEQVRQLTIELATATKP